jgi:hypothetical protein
MPRHTHRTLFLLACLCVVPGADAQVPSVDSTLLRELGEANAELLRAEQAGDTATMRALITPDFSWIRYDAARFGRDARISAVARGRRNPSPQTVLEEYARLVAPNVAVQLRRIRLLLGSGDARRERTTWETRVYVRSGSRWLLAAQHATAFSDSAR